MRPVGWLFALAFIGGLVLLTVLAPGSFSPLGWRTAPWAWGGFGLPIMGLGMLVFCLLMMGGMMMHGGPHMHSTPGSWVSRPRESLSEIVSRRYSQGEITTEEYEEMNRVLHLADDFSANEHAHD